MFGIDDALAEVVMSSTQPALGAIRLAWWREALERLDSSPAPPEPRLQAVAAELLPRGISGKELADIVPGWATLLDEWPDSALIAQRGAALFHIGAGLLQVADADLSKAGALYAIVDVARRMRDGAWLSAADELARQRFARSARPLTALAALASRDLHRFKAKGWEPEATPGRAAALLSHRLFGTVA